MSKARHRFRKEGWTYNPPKLQRWESFAKAIAAHAMAGAPPLAMPIRVTGIFIFPITEGWPQWKKQMAQRGLLCHTAKPDEDNLNKAIKDAFNTVVWKDDSYVCKAVIDKRFGLRPESRIVVETLDGKFPSQIKTNPYGRRAEVPNPALQGAML